MARNFAVTDFESTNHVGVGDIAPDFERPLVNSEFWEDRRLSDLTSDPPVVLIFHPMDGDFPAIYLWNEIRSRSWSDDATVVGLSISTPYEHHTFLKDRQVNVQLFSDPSNGVAEEYGIVHDLDGMAGVEEPRPAVFVIDADRYVEYAWVASEWPNFPDYAEIEEVIAAET